MIGVCPQFDILWSSLTVEEHIKYLLSEARSGKPASNNTIRLLQIHYSNENLDGIERVLLSGKYNKGWRNNVNLLDKRNHNWIPQIARMASEKPSFFAVGAGHLVGENGLITLLRSEGFTLTPVF